MKKFVIRVLTFALLVVGLVGGACALEIAAEIWVYRHRELVAPEGATVFVCGDSRTQMDLNPAHWPDLFNFSASGRSLDETYLTAKDILKANSGKFKTMIVDVSSETAGMDDLVSIGEMISPKYYLLHLLHNEERFRSRRGVFGVLRDNMVKERLKLLLRVLRGKRSFRSSLAAGHRNHDECWKKTTPDRFDRLAEHWTARARKVFDDPPSQTCYWELLDRLIGWARTQGLEVVLITPPWHADLIRRAGVDRVRRFTDFVRQIARERGLRYLNFIEAEYPEEQWLDGSHLNSRGAVVFTKTVRCQVEEERP